MSELIDALPGISLPVGAVTERLARMWMDGDPGESPSEFRASQMNLVLHFGLQVTAEEARERFDTCIRFAQRYPSRIIVLCPDEGRADGSMAAKLFSQCYIGESHREMCCCEALLLAYESEDSGFLANQVSVWLEGDLPTYHWFHRVPAERVEAYLNTLLSGVRRTVYDSSVEGRALEGVSWPDAGRVSDLAKARILPVRQAIGQFLSGYAMSVLCAGLERVTVRHADGFSGEGRRLMEWIRACLKDCDRCEDCPSLKAAFELEAPTNADTVLELEWHYADERYFRWHKQKDGPLGEIRASLGASEERLPTRVKPLTTEGALAEALFF